ncbi:hypothetical protein IWW57_002840 [Coemansia sp. S610]|nr:hypothetical protein IWW57_002840 [Coemansia sp. S610]
MSSLYQAPWHRHPTWRLTLRLYDFYGACTTALSSLPTTATFGPGYWHVAYLILLALFTLPAQSAADIVWKDQTLTGHSLNAQTSGLPSENLVPVRAPLVQGCTLDLSSLSLRSSPREGSLPSLAVVVVWQEAVAAGCFSYGQIYRLFVGAGGPGKLEIRGLVFGSAGDGQHRFFGSPLVEPYGDLAVHNSAIHVMLVADLTAKLLLNPYPLDNISRRATLSMLVDHSPWSVLFDSAGFAAQKYIFLLASASLVLYILWETVLVLCTLTAWNRRVLMYIAALGYLLVFTMLQPYDSNNRTLQMAVYASWIVGYVVFTLFLNAWGSIVEKLHSEPSLLRHHSIAHLGAAIVVSLSILLKLWAFAAESYQFMMIASGVIAYEVPAIIGLQTTFLAYLVWSFLRQTTIIAISRHTKKALHSVAVLCVVAIVGCTCIVTMGIVMASPARFTVTGYVAAIVLYKLGQCLILASIFAVLWVREHARRTRPPISEHEFYVEVESSCICPSRAAGSLHSLVDKGLVLGDASLVYNLAKSKDYLNDQRLLTSDSLARIDSGDGSTHGTCHIGAHVSLHNQLDDHALISTVTRKHSKRHVYVPLEPLSNSQMQQSNSARQ